MAKKGDQNGPNTRQEILLTTAKYLIALILLGCKMLFETRKFNGAAEIDVFLHGVFKNPHYFCATLSSSERLLLPHKINYFPVQAVFEVHPLCRGGGENQHTFQHFPMMARHT